MSFHGDQAAIKTYLLCKRAFLATCTGPRAPNNLTKIGSTTSSVTFTWSQPLSIPPVPTGSYVVSWGSSTGVYNLGTAKVSGATFSYTITGLSASQTIFVVVKSIGVDGCPGGTSAESTFASDSGSNGLLNGLVSYWQFETAAAADVQDGNPFTLAAGVIVPGLIGNAFLYGAAGTGTINPCPANMQLGAGKSFSISTWQFLTGAGFSSTTDSVLGQYSNVAATISYYVLGQNTTGKFRFVTEDTALNAVGMDVGTPNLNAWNHLVIGYNSATKTMFGYLNNGPVQTQVIANDVNNSAFQFTVGQLTLLTHFTAGGIDETGWWNRVLSATDVTNLYNAGAGLPFSSFQA